MSHDLLRRAHLDEDAVLHDRDAIPELQRLGQVVRDEDHRLLHLVLQAANLVLHVSPDQRVQRAERLVEQHDLGVGGERPRETDPLLHAARELVGEPIAPALEPHHVEHLGRLRQPSILVDSLDLEPERDVVDDAPMREQSEVLEHHADLGAPHPPQLVVVHLHDVLTIDEHLAGGRVVDPIDHADERGLARARQAHHHEDLALGDIERDVAHGDDAPGLREQLLTRQVGIGRAHDAIGLRPVDLPYVATRHRSVQRLGQGAHPLPVGRDGPRPDRQIVSPRAESAQARGCAADNRWCGGCSGHPMPSDTKPATTSAMPAYWFATGRSCRNAIESPTAIRGKTAEAIRTIETRPSDAPIE